MKYVHVHLIGGPMCGQSIRVEGMELEGDEYEVPEAVIVPTGPDAAEMYLLSGEDAPCGYPSYLYAGYDWEPGLVVADLDEDEE